MDRLLIERKTALGEWEIYAYPGYSEQQAVKDLEYLRDKEARKTIQRPLRLVKKITTVLDY